MSELHADWPEAVKKTINQHYIVLHNIAPASLKPTLKSSSLTSKQFERFHKAGMGMICSDGNAYSCALVTEATDPTVTTYVHKQSHCHTARAGVYGATEGMVFIVEPFIGFGNITQATESELEQWIGETYWNAAKDTVKGAVGAAKERVQGALYGDKIPVVELQATKQRVPLEHAVGIPLKPHVCVFSGDSCMARDSRPVTQVLHTFAQISTKQTYAPFMKSIKEKFGSLFTGNNIFQPGGLCLAKEDEESLKRYLNDRGFSNVYAALMGQPTATITSMQQQQPTTLAHIIGESAIRSARLKKDATVPTPKPKNTNAFPLEDGMRVITAQPRCNGAVPVNTQGTVLKSDPVYITWDNWVLEHVVAQYEKPDLVPIRANFVHESEREAEYVPAMVSVSDKDFPQITQIIGSIPSFLVEKPRHGAFHFSATAWDALSQSAVSLDEDEIGEYAWGGPGRGSANHLKHLSTKTMNTFGTQVEDPFKNHAVWRSVGQGRKNPPKGDFVAERRNIRVIDKPEEVKDNGFVTPSSERFFASIDPQIMQKVDDKFVVFKNITPILQTQASKQEVEMMQWLPALLMGYGAKKMYDKGVLGNIKAKMVGVSEEFEDATCEQIQPTELNKTTPGVYRFLNKHCCVSRFGLEYADSGITQGPADSGCYNPQTDTHEQMNGEWGIYNKQTGEKLTKGGAVLKEVPESEEQEGERIMEDERAEADAELPTDMASIMVSASLNLDKTDFVGVRSDGRLIHAPLPPPERWREMPGSFTLVLKNALPLDKSFDVIASSSNGRWISDVEPIHWPLVVPVPELAGDIAALQDVLNRWPQAVAAHSRGFVYIKHAKLEPYVIENRLPKSTNPDDRMFIKGEYLRKQQGDKSAAKYESLQYTSDLIPFVFFPGVQMAKDIPSTRSAVEALCPYTSIASQLPEDIIAFDSTGRQFKSLPAINDWRMENGEKVLTGMFVRRNAEVVARINSKAFVKSLTAETLLVADAQPDEDSLVASVSNVRGVPLVHEGQIRPKAIPSIHAAVQGLHLSTKRQSDVAKAMFLSRLPEFGRSDTDSSEMYLGDDMDIMGKEIDQIKDIASKFKKYKDIPQTRVADEISAVRSRIQRMKKVIQSLKKTADQHPMFNKVWINSLASQKSSLETLGKDIADIIEMDLPKEIQKDVLTSETTSLLSSSTSLESLADLIRDNKSLSIPKMKEFKYMLMALLVDFIFRTMVQTFVFTKLKLNNNELHNVQDPEEEEVFGRAVNVPRKGIQLVSANLMKEGDAIACHMQSILFVINHERRSVAYLVNPATVVITHETIERFARESLNNYSVRPQSGPLPTSCKDIPQADVFWPFFNFVLEIFNPDEADRVPSNPNVCMNLQEFVDKMINLSQNDAVNNSIRNAYSQIHTMQEKMARCRTNPTNEDCRNSTWSLEALQKAQKEFAKGDYLTVYQMCSQIQHENVRKKDMTKFHQEILLIAHTSALPSPQLTTSIKRRVDGLCMRQGCVKTGPAHALSVLN